MTSNIDDLLDYEDSEFVESEEIKSEDITDSLSESSTRVYEVLDGLIEKSQESISKYEISLKRSKKLKDLIINANAELEKKKGKLITLELRLKVLNSDFVSLSSRLDLSYHMLECGSDLDKKKLPRIISEFEEKKSSNQIEIQNVEKEITAVEEMIDKMVKCIVSLNKSIINKNDDEIRRFSDDLSGFLVTPEDSNKEKVIDNTTIYSKSNADDDSKISRKKPIESQVDIIGPITFRYDSYPKKRVTSISNNCHKIKAVVKK